MSVTKQVETKMQGAIDHLTEELKGIRTGQANPGMLDSVMVEVYGSPMRLRDIANVTRPELRQLLITPYDVNNNASIGKGIEKANLGFMPVVDGNAVRVTIPAMDENQRKEMAKLCHRRQEECKVSVRNARKEGNDTVRRMKADGDIAEDEQKRTEKQIQDLTDKYCKEADALAAKKEAEVMTI